jgi:phage terminase large subunit GpA-like protein
MQAAAVGWGRDFESSSVQYHVLYGNVTEPLIWARLDDVLTGNWPHASRMPLQLQAVCIDAGFAPAEVSAFTQHERASWNTSVRPVEHVSR